MRFVPPSWELATTEERAATTYTMDRLKDKVAIVTGGANGIGGAISIMFAEEGASVIVADIEPESGETLAHSIRQAGGTAKFCRCDVSLPEDAAKAIRLAAEWNGRVDILCN